VFRLRPTAALVVVVLAVVGLGPARVAGGSAPDVNSLGLTATYDVAATIDWSDRRISVETDAPVTNNTRWNVSRLAFNLATLRTGRADVTEVSVDGAAVVPLVDDQTVLVDLADPLAPSESVVVHVAYEGRLNASSSSDGDAWEFAIIDDVLTAYRWIPWLSRTTRFNRPNVGEPWVTASSPRVSVEVTTDRDVTFATSGRQTSGSGLTQTFEASDVRDFNLAASPDYRTRSVDVGGVPVTFFYRTLPAETVLEVAARAVRSFARNIGPYPHDQLTIAEVGPWAPFESPAHFWLPSNASNRLLPWMVAHETAHQWFYSAVGNDQSREPFADEALSDFISRDLVNRFVDSNCAPGRFDQSIYDIGDCYGWVIYVQGDAWLRNLRDTAGGGRFWSALSDYFARYRYRMGGTRGILSALVSATGEAAVDYRRFPYTFTPRIVSLPFAGAP
jgi:hypothetical protein